MQLIFRRKDGEEITVFMEQDGDVKDFSYNEMIMSIYENRKIEEAKLEGDFTEVEKESITELMEELKEALKTFEQEDDLDDIPF